MREPFTTLIVKQMNVTFCNFKSLSPPHGWRMNFPVFLSGGSSATFSLNWTAVSPFPM